MEQKDIDNFINTFNKTTNSDVKLRSIGVTNDGAVELICQGDYHNENNKTCNGTLQFIIYSPSDIYVNEINL